MNWASQVWPFAHEMKKGEIVVLPSKIKPVIHFGKITGNYEFLPNNDNPYYHAHQVDWFACDIPRTAFDQDILYSFGAFMTICRIKQEDRIKAVILSLIHILTLSCLFAFGFGCGGFVPSEAFVLKHRVELSGKFPANGLL